MTSEARLRSLRPSFSRKRTFGLRSGMDLFCGQILEFISLTAMVRVFNLNPGAADQSVFA